MTFLNVTEIESALIGLNNAYPRLTQLLPLPNTTHEGRRSHALLIRGNRKFHCRPAFVFVSGVHAREWGGPDILVNLAADLLEAYTTHAGLAYGAKTFSAAEVKGIVNRTDVVVFPDINPDGRAYSMGGTPGPGQAMWRKNRNPASGGGSTGDAGVDVNRNYDFLWDFKTKFSPAANPVTLASADPGSGIFHGTGPFSEPETRNVQWLVDRFPRARYFVDVHSYSGVVLHPWGDDENQPADPSKSFMNTAWDGKRGVSGDAYGEYLPAARLAEVKAAAAVVGDGINAVRNQGYVSKQGFWLWGTTYPTSGASGDWAFTREFLNPRKGKLGGFCIEFNKNQTFFPSWAEMEDMILDVDSGLVNLCEYATPSWVQVIWCWKLSWWYRIADRFLTFWRRLFPPEIWGPYGPWTRIVRRLERVLERFSARRGG
ncbi:murein tripeptide amidase MpaA [Arthrobacter sp. V4I6]|uniref:M14 family metallopeptidase n=1 Tax=unclassified Arthrobacter TaxID=235627 RepID=UPI002787EEAB|nr:MULTISPECIES: M14 family metallopeptidase [unclassified Arthrobacter]MDQ0822712.1 murein tripeptide amidase MpaA [Arthrobacter sp. V1I7]MDQ0852340.1 murein tripeptide amidase MpaA [Arthrobacter sp. V4I6]